MAQQSSGFESSFGAHAVPLDVLDPYLEEFAAAHGLTLDRERGTYRQFHCNDRLIQLNLDGNNDGKWYVWICVSEETKGNRYWKRRNLNGPVCLRELQKDLAILLSAAWDEVSAWAAQDTEPH